MKGLKLRTIIGIFCLVLCGAGVLVAHVWKQNAYVRQSMATVKLGRERAALRNDIALLEVSVGGLKKRARIEGLAKERFGLEYGIAPVRVYAEHVASGPDGEGGRSRDRAADTHGRAADANGRTADAGWKTAASAAGEGWQSGEVAWRIRGL